MKIKYMTVVAIMALSLPALANNIVGSTSISFFGTPPKETIDRVRPAAQAALRSEIHIWLRNEMRIDLDTANTVKKFALDKLVERCAQRAEERQGSRGRIWTLSLTVSSQAVREAVRAHNEHYDNIAVSQWDRQRLILESDTAAGFAAAITALSAATARVTTREEGERVGPLQYADIRARVQVLVDRMEVKANLPVIEGRPGSLPSRSPVATVAIAGTPIENFHVTVFTQNGRQLAQMVTNADGEIPLKDLRVPFVHNGSMMTVSPDARKYLETENFIRFRDLGIRFTRGQELSFIYKVPTLTYTLEYRATVKDNAINLPQAFVSDAHIRRYLRDSCNLQPVASGGTPDLRIKLDAEFSKATLNATEEDAYTMSANIEIRGGEIDLSDRTRFERRYAFGTSMQTGEYILEATRALRGLIRGTLDKKR